MNEDDDEFQSRSAARRAVRAVLDDRKQILERFIKLPEHKVGPLDVDGDVGEALILLRRLKASGARARVMKNLSRRASDDDWAAISVLVDGSAAENAARAANDQRLVDWRAELIAGDSALNAMRSNFPTADHQRIRQLVLQSRRNPDSGPAKGARKKLMQVLRALDNSAITEEED